MKSEKFLASQATKGRAAIATGVVSRMRMKNVLRMLLCVTSFALYSSLFTSCSESEDEDTSEYGSDWQQRNEAYFASLEDSLSRNPNSWKKLKSYTKDETAAGVNTDYVYARIIEEGEETDTPMVTDSVRVAYRGRLIPTVSYSDGMVFDQTFIGTYNKQTTAVLNNIGGGWIDGFTTALIHMHRGDYWRVYIPYQLGYGTSGSSSTIPGYSTLIFDIALIDFCPSNKSLPKWSSRQR